MNCTLVFGDSGSGRFEYSIPRQIRTDRITFVGFESLKDSIAIRLRLGFVCDSVGIGIRLGLGFVWDSIGILIGFGIAIRLGLGFIWDSIVILSGIHLGFDWDSYWDYDSDCDSDCNCDWDCDCVLMGVERNHVSLISESDYAVFRQQKKQIFVKCGI